MFCCCKIDNYEIYISQLKNSHTKQLLKRLRATYKMGCEYCWKDEDWEKLECYRQAIKNELATREHIPNKIESKRIRKERIKKGK